MVQVNQRWPKLFVSLFPYAGQIFYQGQDIASDSIKERSERIGYVLQNPNQMISQLMILMKLFWDSGLRGVDDSQIEKRVLKVLKTCGLYEFRKWPISALSFGQRKTRDHCFYFGIKSIEVIL